MVKETHLKNYHKIILGFLILSLFFDFFDKIEMFYDVDLFKFNRYLKLVFAIFNVGFIILNFKIINRQLKVMMLLLLGLAFIFALKNNFSKLYIDEFLRYAMGILIFPLLYTTYKYTTLPLKAHLYKFFKFFIATNVLVVVVGMLFGILATQTYRYGRFGYNGVLLSQGFTPYFYASATLIFWVFKDKWMLLLTFLLAVVSGIKGVYFAEFLLISLLVFFGDNYNKKLKLKIIALSGSIFLLLLLILFSSSVFKAVLASNGFMAMLFSYRTDNLLEMWNHIDSQNYHLLYGALKLEVIRVEMQLFDILLFLGISGLIVFFVFCFEIYKKLVVSSVTKAYFVTCIFLSLLSGNLIYIPMSIMLFLILLFSMSMDSTSDQKLNSLPH